MSKHIEIDTDLGRIRGNEREECLEFLGIKYAEAKRFEYAKQVDSWDGTYDATAFGAACTQYRTYFPHLDVPERRFYHREFREGLDFTYSEDCLNLNIYTPKNAHNAPVLVYIHGGGFNSMANSEGYLDGEAYAKRDLILVCINYRVGVFGYMTHRQIQDEFGRDGNFGLDDILVSIYAYYEKNSTFISSVLSSGGRDLFLEFINNNCYQTLLRLTLVADRDKITTLTERRNISRFYAAAISQTITFYFENVKKKSIAGLRKYFSMLHKDFLINAIKNTVKNRIVV